MRRVATERAILVWATSGLTGLALLLGGGQGTRGDVATQLVAIGVLGILWVQRVDHAAPVWTWWPVAAVLCIPMLQLAPLPASVWTALGGRAELAGELAVAGVTPSPRLGLNPTGSERAFAWLLPGIALYLAALRLPARDQSRLLLLVLAVAAASVMLGLAQLAGGTSSALRFHERTNASGMVGFFANRNHASSLLAAGIPLAMAFAGSARRRSDVDRSAWRLVIALALLGLLLLGLWTTRSRAGLLIGAAVLALSVPLLFERRAATRLRRMMRAGLVFAVLLALQLAALVGLQRIGDAEIDGGRSGYLGATLDAAAHYAPGGSGLGTFRQAYQPFERESERGAGNAIVNHAHNDYLELWLEAGWLAMSCVLILVAFLAWAALHAFADDSRAGHWRQAAALALVVPLLHSGFDYPLRTTAHIALFGLLAGIVASAAMASARERTHVA